MNGSRVKEGSSEMAQETAPPATADERRTQRVRSWRRRVLQRRGALMHAAMTHVSENTLLAMLDETGVVVSWYGPPGVTSEHVVDRHVSQFYLAEEIARHQPLRDLHWAAVDGRNIRRGWRLQPDGATRWSSVTIEAVVLRDGRLQGFSYVSRGCEGPPTDAPVSRTLDPRISRLQVVSLLAPLLFGLASFSAPLPVAASPNEVPEHARVSRYGSGWDCVRGFRRVGDACVHIAVPANAYLDASGSEWRCNRGYLKVNDQCVAIQVPQHAYLDSGSYGKGWRCDRDHREAKGVCVPIEFPVNSHSTGASYGTGWECDRGFRLAGTECLPVAVPANGFLSRSGDNWECERGFRKEDAACVAVQLPTNAHLDYSGNSWTCDEGFLTRGSLCLER